MLAARNIGAQIGGACTHDREHRGKDCAHVDHVADRAWLYQGERRWATGERLQRGDEADGRPLFFGERAALVGAQALDDGDARFGCIDVGFCRLDAGSNGRRSRACGRGGIDGGSGGGFEAGGALQGTARVTFCAGKRAAFIVEALGRSPSRSRQDSEQGEGAARAQPRRPNWASKASVSPLASSCACSTQRSRAMRPAKVPSWASSAARAGSSSVAS